MSTTWAGAVGVYTHDVVVLHSSCLWPIAMVLKGCVAQRLMSSPKSRNQNAATSHVCHDGTDLSQHIGPKQPRHHHHERADHSLQDILGSKIPVAHGRHGVAAEVKGCNVPAALLVSIGKAAVLLAGLL